jgi:[acyl-carrier-protein] S-malonyltransferase
VGQIAFLYPGQGAQYVGMAQELCQRLPEARALFEKASAILGYDLLEVCATGPESRLHSTAVSQPAIYVASLAATEALRQSEPEAVAQCQAAAGLSLGEYTALTFAGALPFEAGVRLVQKRGQAMQAASDATPSGMVSILGLEADQVQDLCQKAASAGPITIANYLCPGNVVVSGARAACDRIEELAAQAGAMKTVRLAVAGAFHTEIMNPAEAHLAAALEEVPWQQPRIPVWSNVDARPHTDPQEIRDLLRRQIVSPVRWEETMRGMLAQGFDRFYELGPGRVLAGLLKRIHRKADCRNVPA